MNNKIYPKIAHAVIIILTFIIYCTPIYAQTPAPFKRFMDNPFLKGASVSFMAKDLNSGNIIYSFDADRQLIPASVMKTVTTAVALEMLGENFRFETTISYAGSIENGVLKGDLYIEGSGDPTLNSSELPFYKDSIMELWLTAIKNAEIHTIAGKVIADESIFDTEGVSMKWLMEDLGSDYGQGSYGLNIFDNQYVLSIASGSPGTKPSILTCEPSMPFLTFHNYLQTLPISKDSLYVVGFPYANDRYLYGTIRTNRTSSKVKGDIPDPPLFFAQYLTNYLFINGDINVVKEASCYRLLNNKGEWKKSSRKHLITTYSPPLTEIVKITNFVSHNLYADALLKTLGLSYAVNSTANISSFEKGAKVVKEFLEEKGLDPSCLWIYDGSGLSMANKVNASLLCDLYIYMSKSNVSESFLNSLPRSGIDGTVRNFLKGTSLQGKLRLKSGSMSRVIGYGGYINKNGKVYAFSLLINNYSGKNNQMRRTIEELLVSLF